MTTENDDDPPEVSEIDSFDVDPDEFDDVNEWAEEEWKASTTAAERVQTVLQQTTEPQTASEIADRARVSTPAARKHLKMLARNGGPAVAIEQGATTTYMRDPDRQRFERIKTLADDHSRAELEEAIRNMKAKIRDFEDEYGVTSPEELARELDPDDEEGWETVSIWKTTRKNLSFAKTTLAFQETRTIDSMGEGVADGGEVVPTDNA